MTGREVLIERGRDVIRLAWEIGGRANVVGETEEQLRILNGLLALSIVEMMAPAHTGSGMLFTLERLGKVLDKE